MMRVFLVIALLLPSTWSKADDGCLYDATSIKPPVISKALVKNSTWSRDTQEYRAILSSGGLVYIKYWACEHVGLNGQLLLPSFEGNADELKSEISNFSTMILKKSELILLEKAVDMHGPIKPTDTIEVTADGYDEFYLKTISYGNGTLITIEYFQ